MKSAEPVSCLESVSELVPRFFRALGAGVAKHPFVVVCVSALCVAGARSGLNFLSVDSDPNKIWVPPASKTAEQQAQFNEVFNPFYRIEQVIFTKTPEAMYELVGQAGEGSGRWVRYVLV